MAYRVKFINVEEGAEHNAHLPHHPTIRLFNTNVDQKTNGIDTFQFSISNDNPAAIHIKEMKTLVQVIDEDTGDLEFEGRILRQSGDYRNNMTERRYNAEDCIAFLHDTKQMPQELKGKPSDIFKFIVERHNALAEPWKQFAVGTCEIDTYRIYSNDPEDQAVRVILKVGDQATIRPTATKIYSKFGGQPLKMANWIKGVTLRVEDTRYVGNELFYNLSRTVNGHKIIEGIVSEKDIIETLGTKNPELTGYDLPYGKGDKAKLKPTATTYYVTADGEGATSIPAKYLTYEYDIGGYAEEKDRYSIYRNSIPIAWVDKKDLIFTKRTTALVETKAPPVSKVNGRYPKGTQVRIKRGVTQYYVSSTTNNPTTIPTNYNGINYRNVSFTLGDFAGRTKRYTIIHNGVIIAWIPEDSLDFGQLGLPSEQVVRKQTAYTEHVRSIEVELDYRMGSYDAIREHLLEPFRAEIEWEMVEGVRTLHIRNRAGVETDEEIRVGLNLIEAQRDFDPSDVPTVIIPIGRVPREERETTTPPEVSSSGSTSGRLSQPTAKKFDASKSKAASPVSISGWSESWVNRFRLNAADPPHVTGAYIDNFLRRYYPDSPLIGAGKLIKDMSDYFGIAAGAAMGVWAKESTFGRGEPGKSHYNYGCIVKTSKWPGVWYNGRQWNNYPNQRVGIAEWFQLVRDGYTNPGAPFYSRNYREFLNFYSPTFENNQATFKNLMWGILKSFGYDVNDTTTKQNYSKKGEDTRSINLNTGAGSAPKPPSTNAVTSMTEKAVKRALAQVGGRYVWGGVSYRANDCSGLIYEAYRYAGFPINHRCTTYTIAQQTPPFKRISASQAQRGDLVIQHNGGHVAILLGTPSSGAGIVHAATPAMGIITQKSITNVNGYYRVMAPNSGGGSNAPSTNRGMFSHYPTIPSKSRVNYGFAAPGYTSHRGTDIVYLDGSSEIYAVDSGVVEAGQSNCFVGNRSCGGGWGNYVRIKHANGWSTLYAHLSSLNVRVGQTVTAGQVIGQMGNTGRSDGKHLHLELWQPNGTRVDAEKHLDFSGYKQLFK